MIKHGAVHLVKTTGISTATLMPIRELVTKGVADAKENITLHPQACDVKGAKRFNGQQCVIAKCVSRTLKPQAVAVGRSLAYVVFKGIAIRFYLAPAAQRLVKEFDQKGRATNAPITLNAVFPSWGLKKRTTSKTKSNNPHPVKRRRSKKLGVRAAFGGIT